jgi:hypothetical protein
MPARTALQIDDAVITVGAGALAFEQQVTSIRVTVTENVTNIGEDRDFADGTTDSSTEERVTFSYAVVVTVQQDSLEDTELTVYTWDHEGEEQPISITPRVGSGKKVTGTVKVVPLDIGGDAKKKNTSDVTWRFTEKPAIVPVV